MLQWFIRNIENIESCAVIFGVAVALWQYFSNRKQNNELRKLQKEALEIEAKQRALNMEAYYKDNILPKISILVNATQTPAVAKVLCKICPDTMQEFTFDEMMAHLSYDDLHEIDKTLSTQDFMNNIKSINKWVKFYEDDNEQSESDVILFQYSTLKTRLCNELEYFASHFTEGTADEAIVYQSLHQTYILAVELLYSDICKKNRGKICERYFTKLAKLYRIWKLRAEEQCAAETGRGNGER